VDYHTPQGYRKRVYFYLNPRLNDSFTARNKPFWGTALEPAEAEVSVETRFFSVAVSGAGRAYWDLARYAPAGWDGRVIFGSNLSMVEPETRLFLRIIPRTRLELAQLEPGMLHAAGQERTWSNVTYHVLNPIRQGQDADAAVDADAMTLRAEAGASKGYALGGVRTWNLFMPTFRLEAQGTTFLALDYLSPAGCEKRAFFLLSGSGPDAFSQRLDQLKIPGACEGEVEVVDLRAQIAEAGDGYEFPLGKYAYPEWDGQSKKCLFRLGALGPDGSARLRFIDNEDFWRF
jgi:hypothetical protein